MAARLVGGPGDGQLLEGPPAQIIDTKSGEVLRELWPASGTFKIGAQWCRYVHRDADVYDFAGVVEEAPHG